MMCKCKKKQRYNIMPQSSKTIFYLNIEVITIITPFSMTLNLDKENFHISSQFKYS